MRFGVLGSIGGIGSVLLLVFLLFPSLFVLAFVFVLRVEGMRYLHSWILMPEGVWRLKGEEVMVSLVVDPEI